MFEINYSTIVEENGKRYLFAEKNFEQKKHALTMIDKVLEGVREWLAANDFPTDYEFVTGALFDSEFVRRKLVEDTEKSNARLKLPKHVAQIHIRAAEAAADELATDKLDELRNEFFMLQNRDFNFHLRPEHLFNDRNGGGVKVERTIVEDLLRKECLREVPAKVEEAAEALKECILKLRPYMDMGLPIPEAFKEFIGNYLAPCNYDDFSDMLPLVRFLETRKKGTRKFLLMKDPATFLLRGGVPTQEEKERYIIHNN